MNNTSISFVSDMDERIPTVIFFGTVGTMGMIGNVLSFIFFLREPATAFIVLVTSLNATDFFVSVDTLINGIAVILQLESHPVFCKVSISLFLTFDICSTCIRVIIALHQCRSTIHPFRKQLSVRGAKIAVVICLIYCVFAAFRDLVVFEVFNILHQPDHGNSTNVIQYTCWSVHGADLYHYMVVTLTYSLVAMGLCIAIIFVSYFLIVCSLLKQERIFERMHKKKRRLGIVFGDIDNEAQDNGPVQSENTVSLENVEVIMDGTKKSSSDATDIAVIDGVNSTMKATENLAVDSCADITIDATADIKQPNLTKPVSAMNETRKERIKNFEKSAVVTMLWVSVGFMLAIVLYIAAVFSPQTAASAFLYNVMINGTFLYCTMSPILYYIRIQRFRKFVNNIIRFNT